MKCSDCIKIVFLKDNVFAVIWQSEAGKMALIKLFNSQGEARLYAAGLIDGLNLGFEDSITTINPDELPILQAKTAKSTDFIQVGV
ncbi:hypothetical protein KL86SPO_50216 [uncultured Sporomusa sp.]|uniref:Uncharacterized protein n=1 Tax=uncultured Sporomusa sp. TaxID=307249 RepID=A0A212LY01_9FIRM|nr:hypothetical protein KL86SPO_50216 [uncultured Sporomusa sp.]